MRVFLAIEIPKNIKKKLAEIQEELGPRLPDVRWESPEKFHVTLIFLGKVEDKRLADLEEAVKKGVKGVAPFKLRLSGAGLFPGGKHPRVVLVGVGPAPEQARCGVKELQKRLAEVLSEVGFEFAKLTKPHVTLGRFSRHIRSSPTSKVQANTPGLQQILRSGQGIDVVGFEVKEVVIMESTLHPTGSVYTPISRIPLLG